MEIKIQPEYEQKTQTNGPRVSFNRDVHVKRFDKRPNEIEADYLKPTSRQTSPSRNYYSSVRKELPKNLTEENIRKEAALVLAQAEAIKCRAESGNEINGIKLNQKFHNNITKRPPLVVSKKFNSLPLRKKKSKPIIRSVSDASSKKSKRPTIFSIFSRKSDPNLHNSSIKKDSNLKSLIRSKSDVGEINNKKLYRKRNNIEINSNEILHKPPVQLSPIIENEQRDDYFDNKQQNIKSNTDTIKIHLSESPPMKLIRENSEKIMHSSQQPVDRPILTKGHTVDGIVKRLSMERFSPPPHLSSPGFSYTRPNDGIVYSQLLCETDGLKDWKQDSVSPSNRQYIEDIKINKEYKEKNTYSPLQSKYNSRNLSDEDEGLGFEPRRGIFIETERDTSSPSLEPPIIPITTNRYDLNEPFSDLSNRRKALESKIQSRCFRSPDRYSPDRYRIKSPENIYRENNINKRQNSPRFHKINSNEILAKYSPERTHLDIVVSPKKDIKTSKYIHKKYYDDGMGEIKEIYEKKETRIDEHDKPYTRESRSRDRLNSSRYSPLYTNGYIHDYEPKSLESSQLSELNSSSPENGKYNNHNLDITQKHKLYRDKKHQRSFDKGDSGIENDFRKESFNEHYSPSLWTNKDIKSSEQFIKRERRHTEETHPERKRFDYIYRERSIDDGSHFDPLLDKYPRESRAISHERYYREQSQSPPKIKITTNKSEKKKTGLDMVRQLFTGSMRKKDSKSNNSEKNQPLRQEKAMHSRHNEYKGPLKDNNSLQVPDISMRRRLSTPKASPLLKRSSSQKTRNSSPLVPYKAEKSNWFKSLDRRSKKSSTKEVKSLNQKQNISTEDDFSTIKSKTSKSSPASSINNCGPKKNLRFFGDTDHESDSMKAETILNKRSKPYSSTLNRTEKYSQSAYNLDRINNSIDHKIRNDKSNSLQSLNNGFDEVDKPRKKYHSRSKNLNNISESGSDDDTKLINNYSNTPKIPPRKFHNRYQSPGKDLRKNELRKPPPGPQKPARNIERRHIHSKERDRLQDSDSSLHSQRSVVYLHATTVGAIPQPYHLNTRRRAVSRDELSSIKSKEQLQPMTRTVSRSVSMLAPWKPKHLHEGYEINYSQEAIGKSNNKHSSTLPRPQSSIKTGNIKKFQGNGNIKKHKYSNSLDDRSSKSGYTLKSK